MTSWSQLTREQKRHYVLAKLEQETWTLHSPQVQSFLWLFAAGMPLSILEAEAKLLVLPVSAMELFEQTEFLQKTETLYIWFQYQYPRRSMSSFLVPKLCVALACQEINAGGSVPRHYEDQLADLQEIVLDPSGMPIRNPSREAIEWYVTNLEFEKLCPNLVFKKLYEI